MAESPSPSRLADPAGRADAVPAATLAPPAGQRLRLDVLAGRHADAVVELDLAFATIGSDPSCDVVLTDDGIAPLHATLHRQAGEWSVRRAPGAPALQVGESDLDHAPCVLHQGDTLRLGGAGLSVSGGTPGARAEPRARPVRDRRWAGGVFLTLGALLLWAVLPRPTDAPGAHDAMARTTPVDASQAAPAEGLQAAPAATPQAASPTAPPGADALTAALQARGHAGVTTRRGDGGGLIVGGLVRDAAERERLQGQPEVRAGGVRLQVRLADDAARQMAHYVDDPQLRFAPTAAGRIEISGNASRPATRERLTKLEKELGQRLEISQSVSYPDNDSKTAAASAPASGKSLGWQIRMLASSSSPPYFETRDGERVVEGSEWKGMEIVKVGAEEILVRSGGRYQRVQMD